MEKYSDTDIKTFAFETAENIEQFIRESTNNLEEKNKNLEALILSFRVRLELQGNYDLLAMYDSHFNITSTSNGVNPV